MSAKEMGRKEERRSGSVPLEVSRPGGGACAWCEGTKDAGRRSPVSADIQPRGGPAFHQWRLGLPRAVHRLRGHAFVAHIMGLMGSFMARFVFF